MKLIIIVKTKKRPKTFVKGSLRFVARSGFDYRIYVARKKLDKYKEQIKIAEEDYYLYIPEDAIKTGAVRIPKKYDLVLYLVDNMKGFSDKALLEFHKQVNGLRVRFEQDSNIEMIDSYEEAKMVRYNHD